MEPGSKSLQLKVISCKNLNAFNFFQKLTIYASVSIISDDPKKQLRDKQRQRQRTQTHREEGASGSYPEWNQEIRFDLNWVPFHDCDDLLIHFEFRHEGVILGDKLIGEVKVPLKDLIQGGRGVTRFVLYEVRSPEGKPNGIFNFSYKVNGMGMEATQSSQILEGKITGCPVVVPEKQDFGVSNQSQVYYPTSEIQTGVSYPTSEIQTGVSYPPSEIQSGVSYPPISASMNPTYEGVHCHSPAASAPPPPFFSSPSSGEYPYYYPPPPPMVDSVPPPPPPPCTFPYPPPPPPHMVAGAHHYQHFGPGAHEPWASDPYFHRVRRW